MDAQQKNAMLALIIFKKTGIQISDNDARTLRLAQIRLRRWFEAECNGDIERDEYGEPYRASRPSFANYGVNVFTEKTRDIEKAERRKVEQVCGDCGLSYYIQTDPRGASLYVDNKPLDFDNYHRAVCCALDI